MRVCRVHLVVEKNCNQVEYMELRILLLIEFTFCLSLRPNIAPFTSKFFCLFVIGILLPQTTGMVPL
jgi:hypothetical protein